MGVSSSVRYKAIHTYGGSGQLIGDVLKSYSVAKHFADELGIDTSYDDWAVVNAESGGHSIVFEVPYTPPGDTEGER
jgi:hypothetical protein